MAETKQSFVFKSSTQTWFKIVDFGMIINLKRRQWTLVSLFIIVPIGFYSKFYQGPAAAWVNNSLGGLFYEIFWCLAAFLFFSKIAPWKIAAIVFFTTCALETLQLWHPDFLELIRRNFIGRTIIGTSFVWSDFLYYFVGSGIGFLWLNVLDTRIKESHR